VKQLRLARAAGNLLSCSRREAMAASLCAPSSIVTCGIDKSQCIPASAGVIPKLTSCSRAPHISVSTGSPMLGALELAGKQTKLVAACGLQLSQRWRLVGTCVRARKCALAHAFNLKLSMHAAAAVDSDARFNARAHLRLVCYCILDTLVIWCQVQ
jgi:hypothetical protein